MTVPTATVGVSDLVVWSLRGGAGLVLAPLLVVALWTWRGWSRPSAVLVLEGFQMYVLAPAWGILAAALLSQEWLLAVPAGVVALSHLAFCLPAATRDAVPRWVAGAPTISVFVANVRYSNARYAEVAQLVMEADADVVVLNESTSPLRAALDAAGVRDRYEIRVHTEGRPFGELLMARLPARDAGVEMIGGQRVPAATVAVGGVELRVHAVHVNAPKSASRRHLWRRNLDGLGAAAASGTIPALYAGDFNSAPWHGPFRRLLARRLVDAHDALGRGLSRSWTPDPPWPSWLGPVMRLDHALVTDGLHPTSLREVVVSGSDHRGFVVEVAVRTSV